MFRLKFVILLSIFGIIIGCIISGFTRKKNDFKIIYEKAFISMQSIMLYKSVGVFDAIDDGLERNQVIITGEDLEVIKREMKDIKEIKEDYAEAFRGYKRGYRAMFVDVNTSDYLVVLYSTEERRFVIRECDIYPQRKADFSKIKVYTFHMTNNVAEIIEKHEQSLTVKGDFVRTWPLDY